jgi:hypothetical protein
MEYAFILYPSTDTVSDQTYSTKAICQNEVRIQSRISKAKLNWVYQLMKMIKLMSFAGLLAGLSANKRMICAWFKKRNV